MLTCPLFRSSEAACRTWFHNVLSQAHRLQAASGHHYGDQATATARAARAAYGRRLHACQQLGRLCPPNSARLSVSMTVAPVSGSTGTAWTAPGAA